MTRQMTDDEVTVLEVIMYLQERGKEAFTEDLKSNCVLTENEVSLALSGLRTERKVSISPRGWVTA